MTDNLSNHIAGIRGFAALYILAHHYVNQIHLPLPIKFFFRFGQECVIVFLLISGFLAYLSWNKNRKISVLTYLKKRAIRIVPLYVICLLISFLSITITGKDCDFVELLGNLLFFQNTSLIPGNWVNCFAGNYVLWYMSYQWWSYVIFGLLFISSTYKTKWVSFAISFVGMVSYMFIPNHISILLWYYWIFFMGVHMGECYSKNTRVNIFVVVATIIMLLTWCVLNEFPKDGNVGVHPFLEVRHFASALFLLIICEVIKQIRIRFASRIILLFKSFAPFSMCIYLFQIPVLNVVSHYISTSWLIVSVATLVTISLSYIVEVKLQNIWTSH